LYNLAGAWGWDATQLEKFGEISDVANEMTRQWEIELELAITETLLRCDGLRRVADKRFKVSAPFTLLACFSLDRT
jgi:hypothetical protein